MAYQDEIAALKQRLGDNASSANAVRERVTLLEKENAKLISDVAELNQRLAERTQAFIDNEVKFLKRIRALEGQTGND